MSTSHRWKLLGALTLIIAAVAGVGSYFISSKMFGPYTAETDVDWATIGLGEFLLENNVWGAPSEPHLQRITKFSSGSFGWNWNRSSPSNNNPYYPEVIYGKKPWFNFSTTRNLPVAVSSVKSLEVSLNVSMNAYGKYNLAFDMWITNDTASRPESITHEIMIWLVWTPGLEAPNIHDKVNDGDNVYYHRTYGKGRYHQFTIEEQRIPPKINLLAFLDHLTNEGENLRYLASIEFGNEVWFGIGETRVTTFYIDLKIIPTTQHTLTIKCERDIRNIFDVNYLGKIRIRNQ